jgi:hypothetical protein
MSTDTTSKPVVNTAKAVGTPQSAQTTQQVPLKSALDAKPPVIEEAPPVVVTETKYKSSDYDNVPIVKMKLKKADTMQYDHMYHLKLDSTEPVEMPLTPFFAARIGQTIEICV